MSFAALRGMPRLNGFFGSNQRQFAQIDAFA
jgi:hypothetical protein